MNLDVLLAVAAVTRPDSVFAEFRRALVTMTGDEFRAQHEKHPVEGYRLTDGTIAVACVSCHEVFLQ